MSSQEVVDFVQSKITQKGEDGELRSLSSIVEEVSWRLGDMTVEIKYRNISILYRKRHSTLKFSRFFSGYKIKSYI